MRKSSSNSRRIISPKQSLLSTKDLNSGGRAFGQRGKRSSLLDQSGSNNFANESGKIRGNNSHFLLEVGIQLADGIVR
jgi:hypothetical protein